MQGSPADLISNLVALAAVGWLLEREVPRWIWLAIFVATGICGNLAMLPFLRPQHYVLGASGAIFGLSGGLVVIWLKRPTRLNRERMGALVALIVLDMAATMIHPHGIAIPAHVAGLVAGLAAGWAIPRNWLRPEPPSRIPEPVIKGTTDAPPPTNPETQAAIVLSSFGRFRPVLILYIDGQRVGRSRGRPPLLVPVAEGQHQVTIDVGMNRYGFQCQLTAGQTAAFRCTPVGWFGNLKIQWDVTETTDPTQLDTEGR